jgi:hypothetical protein
MLSLITAGAEGEKVEVLFVGVLVVPAVGENATDVGVDGVDEGAVGIGEEDVLLVFALEDEVPGFVVVVLVFCFFVFALPIVISLLGLMCCDVDI